MGGLDGVESAAGMGRTHLQVQGGSREVLAAEKAPWKGMGDDIWALLWVSARHYR